MTAPQLELDTARPAALVVAGVDLSLASTGVALSTGALHRIRTKGTRADSLVARGRRIGGIVSEVLDLVKDADLVVIEQPSYGQVGGSVHDRAGLWWLTVHYVLGAGIPVAEVSPVSRARYAVGYAEKKPKGAPKPPTPDASKDAVLAAVINRFPGWAVTGNDVADALLLCALGCDHLGQPLVTMPALHRRALDAVAWPPVVSPR